VIVSHVRNEVEIWSRPSVDAEWTRRVFTAGDVARVRLSIYIAVDALYAAPLPPR
jgi:hypothetical protein